MLKRLSFWPAVVLVLALVACGGGSPGGAATPTSPTPPAGPAPPPTEPIIASGANWSVRPAGGTTGALTGLEGSFNTSGDTISAVLAPFGECFRPDSERLRFAGTRSGRAVAMRSQPLNGQVIDLSGTLSAVGDALEGAYTVTGGCGHGRGQSVVGRSVNLAGVWAGTLGQVPTVIDLQMASTPDETAGYELSGKVTFSNTACFANATITRRARGRWLFPDIVSDTQRLELLGTVSDDLSTMNISYALVQGTCPELVFGNGRLVRR
jgi:hypothetical protein